MELIIRVKIDNKYISKYIPEDTSIYRLANILTEVANLFKKEFVIYGNSLCLTEWKFLEITSNIRRSNKKEIMKKMFIPYKVLKDRLKLIFWKEIEEGKLEIVCD